MSDFTSSAPSQPQQSLLGRFWTAFRRFRRTRPFWGGVLLATGGYFVLSPLIGGAMSFYVHMGTKGITPILLGGGMIAAALTAVFAPAQRHFPAFIAMMFSVASLPLANLGGWIIGMVLGIVGSGLCFAWTPYSDKQLAKFAARDERRAARRAAKHARHSGAVAA